MADGGWISMVNSLPKDFGGKYLDNSTAWNLSSTDEVRAAQAAQNLYSNPTNLSEFGSALVQRVSIQNLKSVGFGLGMGVWGDFCSVGGYALAGTALAKKIGLGSILLSTVFDEAGSALITGNLRPDQNLALEFVEGLASRAAVRGLMMVGAQFFPKTPQFLMLVGAVTVVGIGMQYLDDALTGNNTIHFNSASEWVYGTALRAIDSSVNLGAGMKRKQAFGGALDIEKHGRAFVDSDDVVTVPKILESFDRVGEQMIKGVDWVRYHVLGWGDDWPGFGGDALLVEGHREASRLPMRARDRSLQTNVVFMEGRDEGHARLVNLSRYIDELEISRDLDQVRRVVLQLRLRARTVSVVERNAIVERILKMGESEEESVLRNATLFFEQCATHYIGDDAQRVWCADWMSARLDHPHDLVREHAVRSLGAILAKVSDDSYVSRLTSKIHDSSKPVKEAVLAVSEKLYPQLSQEGKTAIIKALGVALVDSTISTSSTFVLRSIERGARPDTLLGIHSDIAHVLESELQANNLSEAAQKLCERQCGEAATYLRDAFPEAIECQKLARALINTGQIDILAKGINKLSVLDGETGIILVRNGYASQVMENRSVFSEDMATAKVADIIYNTGQLKALANYLYYFDALPDTLAFHLVEKGYSREVVRHLSVFDGVVSSNLAMHIVQNVGLGLVVHNLDTIFGENIDEIKRFNRLWEGFEGSGYVKEYWEADREAIRTYYVRDHRYRGLYHAMKWLHVPFAFSQEEAYLELRGLIHDMDWFAARAFVDCMQEAGLDVESDQVKIINSEVALEESRRVSRVSRFGPTHLHDIIVVDELAEFYTNQSIFGDIVRLEARLDKGRLSLGFKQRLQMEELRGDVVRGVARQYDWMKEYMVIALHSELGHFSAARDRAVIPCLPMKDKSLSPLENFIRYGTDEEVRQYFKEAKSLCESRISEGSVVAGKAWGRVAEAGRKFYLGFHSLGQRIVLIDHIIDLVHNNGMIFDKYPKGIKKNRLTDKTFLDAKRKSLDFTRTLSYFREHLKPEKYDRHVWRLTSSKSLREYIEMKLFPLLVRRIVNSE